MHLVQSCDAVKHYGQLSFKYERNERNFGSTNSKDYAQTLS